MAAMTYKCVQGSTADYLADYIRPPSSATAKLHLAFNHAVPVAYLCLDGQRLPPGTDPLQLLVHARLWNSLLTSITSAGSLAAFKKQLKTYFY